MRGQEEKMSELKKDVIPEEALEEVAGGRGEHPADPEQTGGFEVSVVLDTDEKVKAFAAEAVKSASTITVRNNSGQSVDGKDVNALLALDRSGMVTVSIYGLWNDPFRDIAVSYSIF